MIQENTKVQLIRQIKDLNRSASEEFLARFDEQDLRDYLDSLRSARRTSRTYRGRVTRDEQVLTLS